MRFYVIPYCNVSNYPIPPKIFLHSSMHLCVIKPRSLKHCICTYYILIVDCLIYLDRVFCDKSTNNDVFDDIVRPIIDRGVQGFNGTVFAYGQTGSGKTFTMSGDQSNPGIIPLAINYMFNAMNNSSSREYLLRYSVHNYLLAFIT